MFVLRVNVSGFGTGIYIYDLWVIYLHERGPLCEHDGGDVMAPNRHNELFIQALS